MGDYPIKSSVHFLIGQVKVKQKVFQLNFELQPHRTITLWLGASKNVPPKLVSKSLKV